jgi:diamine N-acetyltransferase
MTEKNLTDKIVKERIKFVDINADNLSEICQLSNSLTESQKNCVASNAYSIAQAHYYPEKAWFKGIYLTEASIPIGFIMLDVVADDLPEVDKPGVYLWRFMMKYEYQKQGYGRECLDLISEKFKLEGKKTIYTSCVKEEADSPYHFYIKYGFVDTGLVEDNEQVLMKILS